MVLSLESNGCALCSLPACELQLSTFDNPVSMHLDSDPPLPLHFAHSQKFVPMVVAYALMYGGLGQLIAGVLEVGDFPGVTKQHVE